MHDFVSIISATIAFTAGRDLIGVSEESCEPEVEFESESGRYPDDEPALATSVSAASSPADRFIEIVRIKSQVEAPHMKLVGLFRNDAHTHMRDKWLSEVNRVACKMLR